MELSSSPQSEFQLLSQILLAAPAIGTPATEPPFPGSVAVESSRVRETVRALNSKSFESLKSLAITNHVIVRAFSVLQEMAQADGNREIAELAMAALDQESARIKNAMTFVQQICEALEHSGCPTTVIKSLDHWPDLGSDLDLYSDADPARIVQVMVAEFNAKIADRSWGDRLANKWNFIVPGLPELVEVHIGRLGQTGEQSAVSRSLYSRSRVATFNLYSFRVLAPEQRIIISTLQRMYRHFYIRLCDIIDNATLLDSQAVDFSYLYILGSNTGLWDGIATYLTIVSGYVKEYRRVAPPLPSMVGCSAKFDQSQIQFRRNFLRVPILPHSMNLYAGELKTLLLRGQLRDSLRLSLLPGLATAAALEQRLTGSDKGIW